MTCRTSLVCALYTDENGNTALFHAVENGHVACVALLMVSPVLIYEYCMVWELQVLIVVCLTGEES